MAFRRKDVSVARDSARPMEKAARVGSIGATTALTRIFSALDEDTDEILGQP